MGCSSSTYTAGRELDRPASKAEESNGAPTTATENGGLADDSDTIPDPVHLPPQSATPVEGENANTETQQQEKEDGGDVTAESTEQEVTATESTEQPHTEPDGGEDAAGHAPSEEA